MLPSGALRTRTHSLGFLIFKSCHLCNYHHCCCTVKTALFSMLIFFHLAKWLPVRDWGYFEWEIDWRALWVWEQSTPSFLWLELSLYRKDLRWSIVLQCQLTFVKIDIFRMSNCYVCGTSLRIPSRFYYITNVVVDYYLDLLPLRNLWICLHSALHISVQKAAC